MSKEAEKYFKGEWMGKYEFLSVQVLGRKGNVQLSNKDLYDTMESCARHFMRKSLEEWSDDKIWEEIVQSGIREKHNATGYMNGKFYGCKKFRDELIKSLEE